MSTPKTTKFTLKRIVENLGKIPDKGLGQETPKLSPDQKKRLMEMASMFENYGAALRNEEAIVNSARAMTELCELAEAYALNECGDWFQQDIVKRDMKEVKKRVMEYGKLAKECYAKMQQLGVAYQDIGHVLGRYYDLKKSDGNADASGSSTGIMEGMSDADLADIRSKMQSKPQIPVLSPEQTKEALQQFKQLPAARKAVLQKLFKHPCANCEQEYKVPSVGWSHGICSRHMNTMRAEMGLPPKDTPSNSVDLKELSPEELKLAVALFSIIYRAKKAKEQQKAAE